MVKILDCTTRDGGFNTNWNFDDEFISNLLEILRKKNITYWEIGYRNHFENKNKGHFYNCTPKFLEKFYNQKEQIQLGVMTDTKRFSYEDFQGKDKDFIDFIRIATHPQDIEKTFNIAEVLHSLGYKIFIQLMDISRIDEYGYIKLFQWENKNILESLYLADSYGTLYPQDIEKYFYKIKTLGYKNISFHAHNTINMALKNTQKAIELGAFSVDVTKNGLGRNGGNLDMETLFKHLKNR
jgi:4-hydroxy 2-oxovalerate aldolase